MPDQSTDGTGSGGSTSDEITPKPDNDEFVILFTNDFHSQIEPADNGKYGLDKYITRRDSPEYVRDYFGEITGPLDGGYVTNSIDFRFFIVSLHSNS